MNSVSSSLIAMIRHGDYHQLADTPSALQPFPLTEEGKQEVKREAQLFAKVLSENGWKLNPVIHSSSSLRAWQTARLYIEALRPYFIGDPVHQSDEALSERSVGCLANLTINQIEQVLEQDPRFETPPSNWKSDSHYRLPLQGAESLMEAGQRVADYIIAQTGTEDIKDSQAVSLFVGHGASFRHAACHLGVIKFCDIAMLSMFHGKAVVIRQITDDSWKLVAGQWKVRGVRSIAMD